MFCGCAPIWWRCGWCWIGRRAETGTTIQDIASVSSRRRPALLHAASLRHHIGPERPALVGPEGSAYKASRIRAHRLAVQDAALSRRKQGFDSPWAHQSVFMDDHIFHSACPTEAAALGGSPQRNSLASPLTNTTIRCSIQEAFKKYRVGGIDETRHRCNDTDRICSCRLPGRAGPRRARRPCRASGS